MPGYEFRLSGIKVRSFGRDTDTWRENETAEALQAAIGEAAYRSGQTADPALKLEGSFGVILVRDPRSGELLFGLNPEAPINIGNIEE